MPAAHETEKTPAPPPPPMKTTEAEVVRGVVQMMQGLSTPLFPWDHRRRCYSVSGTGIYLSHLSRTCLHNLLTRFTYAATCLQLVQSRVAAVQKMHRTPTLRAFASLASHWLQRLRDISLKEEMQMLDSNSGVTHTYTLLGLSASLSSLCSGAEHLWQIVHGAIPSVYFDPNSSFPAAEMAVHVLDYLYKKLDQVCLVQGGEEGAYVMVLHLFVGSLLPYIQCLDSWLFEGTLDDPFEEMFFYGDKAISVDKAEFWDKGYQLRQLQRCKLDTEHPAVNSSFPLKNNKKEPHGRDSLYLSDSMRREELNDCELQVCPLFFKEIAKLILSAGKSLQLIRHVPVSSSVASSKISDADNGYSGYPNNNRDLDSGQYIGHRFAGFTLSESFCVSVASLVGLEDYISRYLDEQCAPKISPSFLSDIIIREEVEDSRGESLPKLTCSERIGTLSMRKGIKLESQPQEDINFSQLDEECTVTAAVEKLTLQGSFCVENPVITVCQPLLDKDSNSRKTLNLSRNFCLPPLNDEALREAVFGEESRSCSAVKGTNYAFGFQFDKSEYLRSQADIKLLEALFPFPTILPYLEDNTCMSELLPFQKNGTLISRVLKWIQNVEPRSTPLPVVIMQDCLKVFISKQVDHVGRLILSKLMNDWRLMDELAVLRAIYLLGSGDLLQHFLTVIFSKLYERETWDDDFELNTILQESIRNSADGMLLSAPDSLVVSIAKNHGGDRDEPPRTTTIASTSRKGRLHSLVEDGFDSLVFTYKVSWPLELIAHSEAIKKYNQVMRFLLKVKHAKFVLDKARRWMWKGRGKVTNTLKRHWLVEQKLLHFVDAFHQYVMDRVYHSAWHELCEGMAAAGSLDEVIEVHNAYLLSIQRQCFVVPDKLGALIATRINSVLGLAVDFYSTQQTLNSGGATSAMKARCEMEVDRIEKQFDYCIGFLLRVLSLKLNVGHFPHLADLVTRINYNYFYMSESGNLMTASGAETATSRVGKAFGALKLTK
ncbi:hypothetical protein Tsubulata_024215 [Turnera subulata]|uniref:Gamma-tubulin complex component n=1 Tax=Turnera subulata TaxID=218843 RepID=A0A9Q0G7L4_9ROSI|nr:hypothetical protein Tsubulata_024215 [Turnera subulata]